MTTDIKLEKYNTDALEEIYAHAFWKIYKAFPKNERKLKRNLLINKIKVLQYQAASNGD
jgi:hypothetical protein